MADSTGLTLITGASRGIGAALAEECARRGSDLILSARSQRELDALATRLRDTYGVVVHVRAADLALPEAPQSLLDWCHHRGLAVDTLVNNAGFGIRGCFADLPLVEQEQLIQVNVASVVRLTRLFLPMLIARPGSYLLNVASMGAFYPLPFMATYGASKAFVLSFTEALRWELRGTRVTVSCLAPGNTRTRFFQRAGMPLPGELLMPVEPVARAAIAGLLRGRGVIVPGVLPQVVGVLARHLPSWVPMRVIARYTRP